MQYIHYNILYINIKKELCILYIILYINNIKKEFELS